MSTSFPIVLATGHITAADELSIQLVEPAASPSVIMIVWPPKATPVRPDMYATCAAKIMRVVARASIELARRRLGWGPLSGYAWATARVIITTRAAFYLKTTRCLIKLIAHAAVRREWRILVFGPPRDQPPRNSGWAYPLVSGAEVVVAAPGFCGARLSALCSIR